MTVFLYRGSQKGGSRCFRQRMFSRHTLSPARGIVSSRRTDPKNLQSYSSVAQSLHSEKITPYRRTQSLLEKKSKSQRFPVHNNPLITETKLPICHRRRSVSIIHLGEITPFFFNPNRQTANTNPAHPHKHQHLAVNRLIIVPF